MHKEATASTAVSGEPVCKVVYGGGG